MILNLTLATLGLLLMIDFCLHWDLVAGQGLIGENYRWPKEIPYQLNKDHSKEQNDSIKAAIDTIERSSCLKFIERKKDVQFIKIIVSLQITAV